MATENKRYYWLKLRENFFNEGVIRFLRRLPEGDTIVVIYLELLCLSLKSEGCIYTRALYETLEDDLALILGEDVMTVRLAMQALQKAKLVETGEESGDERNITMKEFGDMVGSETASTVRSRKCREQKRLEYHQGVALQQAGSTLHLTEAKRNGEIESEKEIEKEAEIESERERSPALPPAVAKQAPAVSAPYPDSVSASNPEKISEPRAHPAKHLYGVCGNVRLTEDEYQKISSDYRTPGQLIDRLSRYMVSTGRDYQDHYQTLCLWGDKDGLNRSNPSPGNACVRGGSGRPPSPGYGSFENYDCGEGESY